MSETMATLFGGGGPGGSTDKKRKDQNLTVLDVREWLMLYQS